jgi:hypothetical protein
MTPDVNLQQTEDLNVRISVIVTALQVFMLFISMHSLEFSLNHQVPQHRTVTLCFSLLATDDLWS